LELAKGDFEGHPFHGNQYTDNAGHELFDNRNIKLQIPSEEAKGVEDAMNEIFGRKPNKEEIAGLIGAPSGTTIKLEGSRGVIGFVATHPYFDGVQQRLLYKIDGKIVLENKSFYKDNSAPEGFGTRVFANQVLNAKKMGVDRIVTMAGRGADANGYYTWARLGYNNVEKLPTYKEGAKGFEGKNDIHEIMSSKEGRDWWKKNGSDFEGKFDLNEGSKSLQVLKNYLREKKFYVG